MSNELSVFAGWMKFMNCSLSNSPLDLSAYSEYLPLCQFEKPESEFQYYHFLVQELMKLERGVVFHEVLGEASITIAAHMVQTPLDHPQRCKTFGFFNASANIFHVHTPVLLSSPTDV